jgi:ring-1,2-phenylacetyl-CoA epoxidase subunit PaaE
MKKFQKLVVADVQRETEDAVSIAFDLTAAQVEQFQFIPGQYLSFKAIIGGEEVRRSYSICSSPFGNEKLRVAVKRVEDGKFSNFANNDLKTGDELEVMPPMGNFHTALDASRKMHYVAFAAGSGITPILSIMKSVLRAEPLSEFTLFYGNRSANSILFKEEIEDLKNQHLSRLRVHHVLSREDPGVRLFKGRLDKAKCELLLEKFTDLKTADEFFLCGPEEMINDVSGCLKKTGIAEQKIRFELFTTPTQNVKRINQVVNKVRPEDSFSSKVRIIMDGDETEFYLKTDDLPVLDAALREGLDVPYACKGAVCCTCKAKVLEGKVRMDMNYSLEKDEIDAGYVLTCQAHPESKSVVLDYDS